MTVSAASIIHKSSVHLFVDCLLPIPEVFPCMWKCCYLYLKCDLHVEWAVPGPQVFAHMWSGCYQYVGCLPVSGVGAHHLRSQEGWSAVTPLQVLVAADDDLAAAKVTQGDVAPRTHQHIFRLQVAVHHLVVMQVVQSLQDRHE